MVAPNCAGRRWEKALAFEGPTPTLQIIIGSPKMTVRWLLLCVVAVAVLQCLGCKADRRRLTAKERSELDPISKGIKQASSLTLYEGLPHQTFESELLA